MESVLSQSGSIPTRASRSYSPGTFRPRKEWKQLLQWVDDLDCVCPQQGNEAASFPRRMLSASCTRFALGPSPLPTSCNCHQTCRRSFRTAWFPCFASPASLLCSPPAGATFSTIHWPWMWDTQIFHYAVFLMRPGQVPYKDIYDMNMPGCYLMERWAMAGTSFEPGNNPPIGWNSHLRSFPSIRVCKDSAQARSQIRLFWGVGNPPTLPEGAAQSYSPGTPRAEGMGTSLLVAWRRKNHPPSDSSAGVVPEPRPG